MGRAGYSDPTQAKEMSSMQVGKFLRVAFLFLAVPVFCGTIREALPPTQNFPVPEDCLPGWKSGMECVPFDTLRKMMDDPQIERPSRLPWEETI